MPTLLRAELGRATWKYFHTVMARFPEKPTEDQQEALRSYIFLFARLYPWYGIQTVVLPPEYTYLSYLSYGFRPCATYNSANNRDSGECAEHFQQHLNKYPPQVSSRKSAAGWACFIHNEVNAMLEKPEFDCTNLGAFYDCGCAEDESEEKKEGEDNESKEGHSATSRDGKQDSVDLQDHLAVEISKEE